MVMSIRSSTPLAGIAIGLGIETITSGWIFQPSVHRPGDGLSFASPSEAPPSTHATSVLISLCVSVGSFRNRPYRGSAVQGGIFLVSTAALIAFAQGRVLS